MKKVYVVNDLYRLRGRSNSTTLMQVTIKIIAEIQLVLFRENNERTANNIVKTKNSQGNLVN